MAEGTDGFGLIKLENRTGFSRTAFNGEEIVGSAERHHHTLVQGIVKLLVPHSAPLSTGDGRSSWLGEKVGCTPTKGRLWVAITFDMLMRRGRKSDHHQSARLPALWGQSYALAQTRNRKHHR